MPDKKPSVLVIEDDEGTSLLLETYIRMAGAEPLIAHDGARGLELAYRHKPPLMVVDIMIPEVHGVAVCRQIKTDSSMKKTRVMVISVKNFPADHRQVSQAGADLFMPKPLDRDGFIAAVRRFLGRRPAAPPAAR